MTEEQDNLKNIAASANDYAEYMNDPMIAHMKQQWEAMNLAPEIMAECMNNLIASRKQAEQHIQQVQQTAAANPYLQNVMNMQAGIAPQGDMLNMYDDAPQVKEDSGLNEAETKAILCGANTAYNNSCYLNTLSTFQPVDDILFGLEEMWDINSREEMIAVLDWLESAGHRVYFDLIWQKLRSIPKAEWRSAIKQLELQAMVTEGIESERIKNYAVNILAGYPFLLTHGCFATMKDPDITAWDLNRAINLCRWGYDVEFLGREEALERIQRYAGKMYKIYDSWKSLSEGYLIGYAMWNGDEDMVEIRWDEHEVLLKHEKSLWNTIKW